MREAMAVTGYVTSEMVNLLSSVDQVEVWPERNVSEVVMRVSGKDVQEIRVGAAENGLTLVQLILKDGAEVETASRATVGPAGMAAFHDPILNRVRQEATAKKIML